MCTICKIRPKDGNDSYCEICRKGYLRAYRRFLKMNPDYHVNQRPCVKCKQRRRMLGQRYCLPCDKEYRKKVRPRQRLRMSKQARYKESVRRFTRHMIERGVLKKEQCRDCGSHKVQAHHPDYSKPLEVIWLCRACHRAEHNFKI